MPNMKAKVRVSGIAPHGESETVVFNGVAASSYPADGSDEDNTFAKFSPSVNFSITIANPALIGKFAVGDTYYADFTPAPAKE